MDDELGDKPTADEIWPPSPTLPPPEPVRAPSFMSLHPVLFRILISFASGLFMFAINIVSQLVIHRRPAIDWIEAAIAGIVFSACQQFIQSRPTYRSRKQKRIRKAKFLLKAKAAEQDATE